MRGKLGAFTREFWIVNTLELVERGAYYGMVAVLSFYFVTSQDVPVALLGLFIALLQALLYFVPVVASPLAEKYGYRRSLLACFAVMAAGYGSLGMFPALRVALGTEGALLLGVLVLGVGAGFFKPVVQAAVARSTSPEQRSFGFTIYYAMINIGAFLAPLAIAVTIPQDLFGLVFFLSTGLSLLNLVATAVFYRDTVPAQSQRTVRESLGSLVQVARQDRLFVLLLAVYAGFWFMYAQYQFFLQLYQPDFVPMPAWFNVALLATVNPGTIILLGPLLGRFTSPRPALAMVILGTAVYIGGTLMYGLTSIAWLFFAGVIIASIGEVITHPSFLSYASKAAPPDKVAVYLGLGFLPLWVGLTAGSAAGGVLYHELAEVAHLPGVYWAVTAAVGVVTIAGLLLVNRALTREKRSVAMPGRAGRVLASRAAPLAAALLIPLVLLSGLAPGAQPFLRVGDGADDAGGPPPATVADARLAPVQGTTGEGEESVEEVALSAARAQNLTFTLRWTDEPSGAGTPLGGAAVNQPDRFQLRVTTPQGGEAASEEVANPQGAEGVIVLEVPVLAGAADGSYSVAVRALACGDTQVGPVMVAPDNGNAWTLETTYRAPA